MPEFKPRKTFGPLRGKYAKGRVVESLQFISGEIKEFDEDYASKQREDYRKDKKLQKLMDRTVENILTALIEVSGTVLTQEGIPIESYAQVLSECAKRFGFSEKQQEELSKLAIQRDRLAHRYLNFRWQAISVFVKLKPLISRLLEKILAREE